MNGESLVKDLRKGQMETWLKLANSSCNSDNEFLERFYVFLKEGYTDSERKEYVFSAPSWAAKQQIMLKDMLDFEAFRLPSMQKKGCALIGKTNFSKLKLIKSYFAVCGLLEFTGGETERHYAVVNCSDIKGYNGLINVLVQNQDVAYIIFDNCDSLLKHDGVLQAIKQLSEDFPGLTVITKNGESVNFKTESFFVFLGEENTLHTAVEKQVSKGLGARAYNHFQSFIHYIRVFDFDTGDRYFGHEITPIYD